MELIRERVSAPGCCCCMPLQHNRLMDSCSYVQKIHYQPPKGGAFAPPLPAPKSATEGDCYYISCACSAFELWCAHMCTHIDAHTHIYTNICTLTLKICTLTLALTLTLTHPCMHKHTHIHVHTPRSGDSCHDSRTFSQLAGGLTSAWLFLTL